MLESQNQSSNVARLYFYPAVECRLVPCVMCPEYGTSRAVIFPLSSSSIISASSPVQTPVLLGSWGRECGGRASCCWLMGQNGPSVNKSPDIMQFANVLHSYSERVTKVASRLARESKDTSSTMSKGAPCRVREEWWKEKRRP